MIYSRIMNNKGIKIFRKGVSALILSADNKILLVNLESFETKYFAVPGGGVEQDETSEQSVYREIKEELGIEKDLLMLQGVSLEPLQILFKQGKLHRDGVEYDGMERKFFGFRYKGDDSNIVLQKGEIRSYMWVPFRELKDYLLFDGQLQQTVTKLLEIFPEVS